MNIAVLSDIHGNVRAFDAVRADLRRRGIDTVVNLGDCLYGPFDPRPVADRLLEERWPTVSGNEDRCLVELYRGGTASRTARFTADRLESHHIEGLESLPTTLALGCALLFHASPTDDARYLVHRPTAGGGMRETTIEEIARSLEDIEGRLILCGHDHLPRVAELPDDRAIVNPGSVGCPAYTDDGPPPHAVENRSPHARYAVVRLTADRIEAQLIRLAYDWDAAADEAERNGFPEWGLWLRTGRVVA